MQEEVWRISAQDNTAAAFNSARRNLVGVKQAFAGVAAGLAIAGFDQFAAGAKQSSAALGGLAAASAFLSTGNWIVGTIAAAGAAMLAFRRHTKESDDALKEYRESVKALLRTAEEAATAQYLVKQAESAKKAEDTTRRVIELEEKRARLVKESQGGFAFGGVVALTGSEAAAAEEYRKAIASVDAELAAARTTLTGFQKDWLELGDAAKKVLKDMADDKAGKVAADLERERLERMREGQQEWTEGQRALNEQLAATNTILGSSDAITRFNQEVAALVLQHEAGKISALAMEEGIRQLDAALREDLVAGVEEAKDQLDSFADQGARNLMNAFEQFFFDPFNEGLDGLLKNFLNIIRQIAAQEATLAIFGEKGSGGLYDGISGFFKGLFAGGFASGGTIPEGKFGVVGEDGPEFAFGPKTIVPMSKARGRGGITISPVIHVQAGVSMADVAMAVGIGMRESENRIQTLLDRGLIA